MAVANLDFIAPQSPRRSVIGKVAAWNQWAISPDYLATEPLLQCGINQ